MRIMLTVVSEHGHRDVVAEGDEETTVAGLAAALKGVPEETLGNVVRLARARAPYGMGGRPRPAAKAGPGPEVPSLWVDGRRLDPDAPVVAALRDGDLVTLDQRTAGATVLAEPGGVAEVRVVGGPAAGSVHRLGLGVHVIGSGPACAVPVDDPDMPAEAVEIRVTPDEVLVRSVTPPGREPAERPRRGARRARRAASEPVDLGAPAHEIIGAMVRGTTYSAAHVAGEQVGAPRPWPEGAPLTCGNSVLVLRATEAPDAHLDALPEGGLAYNRPPRLRPAERRRRFEVPAEPSRGEGMRLQLLAAFLPAVLGLALAWVFQMWFYLLIALMTPMIMIGQWISDRRHGRRKYRQDLKAYKERQAAFKAAVEKARAVNEVERRAASPDPAELLLTATGPRGRLWERRSHDPDALRLRVGLADLPAEIEFVPERGASADLAMPEPPTSGAVPVSLAMRRLGVAGVTGPRDTALGVARSLVGAAVTLHSPRDLAVVVLCANADGAARWNWARWLPHCAPRDADAVALVGADPEAAAQRVSELAALIATRLGDDDPQGMLGAVKSWGRSFQPGEEPLYASYDDRPYDVLVILDGAQVLRGLPGMPQVLRQGPRAGVYTIAIDEDQRLLPEECATVVDCGESGFVRLRGGGLDAIGEILADRVSAAWCDRLARSLAPLRDVSRDDATAVLPGSVRLLDLLALPAPTGRAIASRWRAGGRTTRVPIGVGPEGPFSVDLRTDGPHALVAGTTGAGKSELLQTLICSLAVANRPDEMTFVLIDYKGGAAFKECVRLPHTVGMVSDLDEHLTQRALSSLAAEIRRRERLLLAAGAKDIDDYQELDGPRAPLPRLLLIIDEFAAMVSELPDFVDGLVDIARRGRSLGIHLVLATQRPAGVVTADIQANTSLRIALRVTEPAESADVISGPEAAHISKSTPGRCYVRSGAAPAQPVQTARIGGRAVEGGRTSAGPKVVEVGWRDLGHPLRTAPEPVTAGLSSTAPASDLAVLVDAVVDAARVAGVPGQPSPWLPPLPESMLLDDLDGPPAPAGREVPPLPFGVTDLPAAQDRRPLALDLPHGGHLLIAGTARTGRSTALRTLAASIARLASPQDVHLHAIDCGSGALLPFVALPHCGAVVTRDQLDRVERLLARLRAEIGRRQQVLAEAGYASLAEARQAAGPHSTLRMPWLVLLLDRWEGFAAAFEGYDYGRLLESLMQLLREGPAVGLRAVVTADRSGLLGQISTLFDDRLIMRLADPADYGLAGLPPRALPTVMPPGRALSVGEQGVTENQIALLDDDPSGPAQVAVLQSLAKKSAERFPSPASLLRVDALPMRVTAAQALDLVAGFTPPSPLWALLGAGGDSLAPLGVDLLAQGPAAVVAGPSRSGRSSALLTAARSLLGQDTPVAVVAPRRSPLRDLAGQDGVLGVVSAEGEDLPAVLLGHDRYVVLVDDAELISPDSPLGMALESTLRSGRDGEHGLLVAGTTGDLATAYRGFVAEARKSRTGLLLSVQSPADGDLFNVRLPRGAVGGPPGRGLLVISGTVTPIQAALSA
ncbi:cell division protein FtsK [Sphaerisporangium krabiense]|uniref:S-DNA-T family DNA segregation ATPase FtsK/SpoIIIE n=1 Tax=Sphaerisporangium krabiense TaxID=763782 RepID=A0A7W8YZN3_9ACTN|nr:FtsK/SpoIIIE domain-containing protein [Sphaerisporangium krabiense]MBB5624751.1 S-DNA-T family DNA segregation ATPase FtsK/SpoIIIE [Sphaerisporangium krabiense]GII61288.1 cell division protein FtsK [Sphaerisporangium krabiense]